MLPLLFALSTSAQAASGFAGVEWRPLSRQDLVFVDEGRTSGTAVGEFDGSVRPVLSAYGGAWFNRYVGLSVGLGLATLSTETAAEDTYRQRTWGVFRPSLDLRFGWIERKVRFPIPWVVVGAYGDVPTVVDVSNAYTAEEQEAADVAASNESFRLGGVGGRIGMGVDYQVLPGLAIGAQVTVGIHRATYTGGDDTFTSLWVATEAAILLSFEWPSKRRGEAEDPEPVGDVEDAEAVPLAVPVVLTTDEAP